MIDMLAKIILLSFFAIIFSICIWYMIKSFKSDMRIAKLRVLLLEDECEKRGILNE